MVHIENATDTLLKLKPQNYDKLEDIGSSNVIGHESGLMAQDLWYDAPELRHMVILGKGAEPTEEKPPRHLQMTHRMTQTIVLGDLKRRPCHMSKLFHISWSPFRN